MLQLDTAIVLAGGEWFSGIALALTAQMLWRHGVSFEILNDKKRQILLNLICLVCAVNTTISYGFNATEQSLVVSDVTTVVTFVCIQYALVIMNHNSLVRATNFMKMSVVSRGTADRFARVLYFLPLLSMIPVYLSIADVFGSGRPLNTSDYNSDIFKPLNIVLLVLTEAFASTTDVLLLLKVQKISANLDGASARNSRFTGVGSRGGSLSVNGEKEEGRFQNMTSKARRLASADLWASYGLVWALIIVDVGVKALISAGLPLRFDSIITITTLALRSRANLQYGLELQSMFSAGGGSRQTSQRQAPSQISDSTVRNV